VAAAHAASLAEAMQASAAMGEATAQAVDRALTLLRTRLSETGIELTAQEDHITRSTQRAERLLELVQSAGQHSRSELPDVLRASEAGLDRIDQRIGTLHEALAEAGLRSRAWPTPCARRAAKWPKHWPGSPACIRPLPDRPTNTSCASTNCARPSKPRAARPRRFRATSPERSPARSTAFTPQRKPQGRP
jgi:hypothetical protein